MKPRPIRTRTVNLASVSVRPERARLILMAAVTEGDPDLILAVECADLDVRDHVDQGVWQVIQFGRSITDEGERVARSGCALLARRGAVALDKPRLRMGSEPGEGIRARYILTARATFWPGLPGTWRSRVRVGHAPPPRAPLGRGRFLDVLRDLTGIRGGDLNVSAETARDRFPIATVSSAGVLHLLTPRWIPVSEARRRDVGSDHPALDVTLWPNR